MEGTRAGKGQFPEDWEINPDLLSGWNEGTLKVCNRETTWCDGEYEARKETGSLDKRK